MGQLSPNSKVSQLAASVVADILVDQSVDVELPGGGYLHLDRPVPLICVYRRGGDDAYIEQILDDEPAYLIVPSAARSAMT